jgi:hypothetical protein
MMSNFHSSLLTYSNFCVHLHYRGCWYDQIINSRQVGTEIFASVAEDDLKTALFCSPSIFVFCERFQTGQYRFPKPSKSEIRQADAHYNTLPIITGYGIFAKLVNRLCKNILQECPL